MLQKLKLAIISLGPVQGAVALSKRLIIPGLSRIPLYDVVKIMQDSISKGLITTRASSLAFKFFLAIFPGVIFLFSLIPYIPIHGFHDQMMLQLELIMPADAYSTVQETINDILNQKRGGLLSIGFIITIYFATNGINAMMNAFNTSINPWMC